MLTSQDVIKAFLELPEKGQEEVRHFVNSNKDDVDFLIKGFEAEYVREENYSEEDQAVLDRCQEDAKKGINMSGPFNTTDELFAHLDSLKSEQECV